MFPREQTMGGSLKEILLHLQLLKIEETSRDGSKKSYQSRVVVMDKETSNTKLSFKYSLLDFINAM